MGAVPQRDADLLHLWTAYSRAGPPSEKAAALTALDAEVDKRDRVDSTIRSSVWAMLQQPAVLAQLQVLAPANRASLTCHTHCHCMCGLWQAVSSRTHICGRLHAAEADKAEHSAAVDASNHRVPLSAVQIPETLVPCCQCVCMQATTDLRTRVCRPSTQTPTCCCLLSSCWATLQRPRKLRAPLWTSL